MITTPVDTIYTAAHTLLTLANAALVDNGLTPPGRQYVSMSAPAWDCCDLLTVHFLNIKPNNARTSTGGSRICAQTFVTELQLSLVECVPTGDPFPTPEELNTSAHGFYQRAWVLYQDLSCNSGLIQPGCNVSKIGPMTPHGPQGGCASITVDFTVELA